MNNIELAVNTLIVIVSIIATTILAINGVADWGGVLFATAVFLLIVNVANGIMKNT